MDYEHCNIIRNKTKEKLKIKIKEHETSLKIKDNKLLFHKYSNDLNSFE